MTLGEQIKHYRKRSGYSMEELGALLGVSRQTVFRYESGAIENIPREKIRKMASLFSVSEARLLGFEDSAYAREEIMAIEGALVPMLGEIACGEPIYASEENGRFVMADARLGADFCLCAKGDCVINVLTV